MKECYTKIIKKAAIRAKERERYRNKSYFIQIKLEKLRCIAVMLRHYKKLEADMIANLLKQVETPEDLDLLVPLLLTPEELSAINGRIVIYKELLKGKISQRSIAKEHNLSIATITRGSNNLKSMSSSEKKLLTTLLIKE